MRLNVCFIEMALFGPFAALIKGCSSYGRNWGQPTRGDGYPARNESVRRCETWASWRFRVFPCSVWSAIVAIRICSESAVYSGFATVVGTGGDTALEVRVLLSWVLKLLERTLVNRAYQLTRMLLFPARAETAESTSSTVEDGGRERCLWSGCEPKPVSADQMHSTHGTQSPRAQETASSIVCGT